MTKKKYHIFSYIFLIFFIIIGIATLYMYKIWKTTLLDNQKYIFIYVFPSMNVEQLGDTLISKKIIKSKLLFKILSKELKLSTLKPGKYRITNKMTLPAIIRMFKNGKDEKVNIYIHPQIIYYEDFINTLDNKLMISKDDILKSLQHHPKITNKEWMNYLFIKQYKVSWAIQASQLLDSILNYYNNVWNDNRKKLLHKTQLSQKETMILSSIIQHESHIYSEQRKIAGVYINRLRKGMPLQADPTLKYINHKMTSQRLYNADKQLDSPYNTYKYKGLPPTTIGAVSITALDAVLNYESHDYLYFCAKPELNGYSNYSKNYQQHLKYAKQYQRHLDKLNIK